MNDHTPARTFGLYLATLPDCAGPTPSQRIAVRTIVSLHVRTGQGAHRCAVVLPTCNGDVALRSKTLAQPHDQLRTTQAQAPNYEPAMKSIAHVVLAMSRRRCCTRVPVATASRHQTSPRHGELKCLLDPDQHEPKHLWVSTLCIAALGIVISS